MIRPPPVYRGEYLLTNAAGVVLYSRPRPTEFYQVDAGWIIWRWDSRVKRYLLCHWERSK